jgi:hypothetical protein
MGAATALSDVEGAFETDGIKHAEVGEDGDGGVDFDAGDAIGTANP